MAILCVGGVDSSHGAGLDADREAAEALGVEVRLVATAHTLQDVNAVQAVDQVRPGGWLTEARAHLVAVRTIKFGLLPGADHVAAAAELVDAAGEMPWVLDPVLAASNGHEFLDGAARAALLELLLPRGPVLTPNLPEAAILAGLEQAALEARAGREEAARRLLDAGAAAVVLKGGHGSEAPVANLVQVAGAAPRWQEHPRAAGSLRGTGCRFAAALACHLSRAESLATAAERAGAWVGALVASRGRP